MRHKSTDTNKKKIDSMAEQVDEMSRLTCNDPIAEKSPSDVAERPAKDECVVDFERLISRVGDEDLIEQVMPICIDDNRRHLEMLGEAVTKGDSENVRNRAHSIKGSAANMGADQLAEPAGILEHLALKGDLNQADDLLCRIRTEFEKLEAFVENPNWMEKAKISSST